jgi:hypothetical protein
MGESAQLNFAPKIFGRNFADLGEFPPNQQIFGWTLGRNSPKSKEIRPQILGRNLNARIRPFSGEQELLCNCVYQKKCQRKLSKMADVSKMAFALFLK